MLCETNVRPVRNRSPVVLAAIFVSLLSPAATMAAVYKCKAPDGKLVYQQAPCPSGQTETRPFILKGTAPTGGEQFSVDEYTEEMRPAGPDSAQQSFGTPAVSNAPKVDSEAERKRAADCNKRYDELASEVRRASLRQAKADRVRQLQKIEDGRTTCLYGGSSPSTSRGSSPPVSQRDSSPVFTQNDTSGARIGQCQGQCASEQGICISQCQGNGQCVGNCAASHGRCVGGCIR